MTKYQVQQIGRNRTKSLILGNYTILDEIGAGGMGQVYKARHRRMERVVAIKTLPAATVRDPSAVARFQREVVAAAKLRHPNIVAADDADEAGGIHFLVMEYVDGRDLSAVVKDFGPLPVATAVGYVIQAARGLEFAHKRGVVHRDIKPANLLLDGEGTVKVLDMGLARLSGEGDVSTLAELTGTGAVMGTIDYMAPEQAVSTKHADARADVYSLGCTLHYLLTGRPAYPGNTLMARLIAHRDAPIPRLGDDAPAPVRTAFERMVAKRPEDRFQTMAEVIAALDLDRYHNGLEPTSVDPGSPRPADGGASTLLRSLVLDMASDAEAISPRPRPAPPRRGRRLLTAAGATLLGLAVIAGMVVTLLTKEGTLVVDVDQPDARVQVLDAAGKVEITLPGEAGHISIAVLPGKHKLRVEKDGFAVNTSEEVVIESRGTRPIRVHLEPLATAKATSKPWDTPKFRAWMEEVAALSPEKQLEAVSKKLMELNPRFDGTLTKHNGDGPPLIRDGAVVDLGFSTDHVADISPVRALPGLGALGCHGSFTSNSARGTLTDLSPLTGMKMNLLNLSLNSNLVDLSPVKQTAPKIFFNLFIGLSKVRDLSPLKGMPVTVLDIYRCPVEDFSQLKDLPILEDIRCDFLPESAEILRSMKSLKQINYKKADEFWKAVEAAPK